MEDDYLLSVRTEDLPEDYDFILVSRPSNATGVYGNVNTFGFLGFLKNRRHPMTLSSSEGIKGGMNEKGLSCDKQTLRPSEFPPPSGEPEKIPDLDAALFCRWALENFSNVNDLRIALTTPLINIIAPQHDNEFNDGHYIFRDRFGQGIVVEFVDGKTNVYIDNNDNGKTGFGVTTNEPQYPWQVEGIKLLQWKSNRTSTAALGFTGDWYPDSRFQRIWLVKNNLTKPKSYREAIANAVSVLNVVTVPRGTQPGKDNKFDRTLFGVVYDHINSTLYWRSQSNMNLQRLQLKDVVKGKVAKFISVQSDKLKYFNDVGGLMTSTTTV
eukprot:g3591.t1